MAIAFRSRRQRSFVVPVATDVSPSKFELERRRKTGRPGEVFDGPALDSGLNAFVRLSNCAIYLVFGGVVLANFSVRLLGGCLGSAGRRSRRADAAAVHAAIRTAEPLATGRGDLHGR
ncbi:MAG TPA: hypothetical protein VMQ76_00615 [Terracidiphilus sp.]|nr:hypothetical protein [Terracidiphilus sp.]